MPSAPSNPNNKLESRRSASSDRQRRTSEPASSRARPRYERAPLLAAALLTLLSALWAGLIRLGWNLPQIRPQLYAVHGPLMVCGFLGTLISLERAVALGKVWGYAAPLLTGAGGLALLFGVDERVSGLLIVLGSFGLIANFAAILKRQFALFTVTMALGALAWSVGNSLWVAGQPIRGLFPWWAAFLVLTIAGERLELSRLTGLAPQGQGQTLFFVGGGVFLVGVAISAVGPGAGIRLAGVGMLAMALWLMQHDLARRTVRQRGLTRFIAINLLAGYIWLGAGGIAWLGFGDSAAIFRYDVMLHAVFLGFVFSMIFAHAPIIFPAILNSPLPFSRAFYAHFTLLHLSLLLRIGGDLGGWYEAYKWGGMLNVVAVVLFLALTIRAVVQGLWSGLPKRRLRDSRLTAGLSDDRR